MNKTEFIKELVKKTGYDEEKCIHINHIIEDTFLIGKKNKEKIINQFQTELKLKNNDAEKLYEKIMDIIGKELKDKIKHPFKNQEK